MKRPRTYTFLFGFKERVNELSPTSDVKVWQENYLNFFMYLTETYDNGTSLGVGTTLF